jgi:hypothetical protein
LDYFRDVDSEKTQEAEAEKQDLVAQATDVMTQKTELGEAQKTLQHQLNEVKALISEFEDKRAAFGVRSFSFSVLPHLHLYIDNLFFWSHIDSS